MSNMVEYMVDLLFNEVEESDEVRALHDEVLANCQEHYADLIHRGMSEDDALAAVTESLQGMEEVVAGYPKKKNKADTAEAGGNWRTVDVNLIRWDAELFPSADGRVHVNCEGGNAMMIATRFENDRIVIVEQKLPQPAGQNSPDAKPSTDWVNELKKLKLNNFEDFVTSVRDLTEKAVKSVSDTISDHMSAAVQSGTVRIELPASVQQILLHSISGDLNVEQLDSLRVLEADTTSGDIRVSGCSAETVRLKGKSGDVRFNGAAEHAELSTMSGDVTMHGSCGDLQVSTISGDAELYAESGALCVVRCKTISGDIGIECAAGLKRIDAHSTSGDVQITLPDTIADVHTALHTVSGDIKCNVFDSGDRASILVAVDTVSGDIRVQ